MAICTCDRCSALVALETALKLPKEIRDSLNIPRLFVQAGGKKSWLTSKGRKEYEKGK